MKKDIITLTCLFYCRIDHDSTNWIVADTELESRQSRSKQASALSNVTNQSTPEAVPKKTKAVRSLNFKSPEQEVKAGQSGDQVLNFDNYSGVIS
jgi:hypothetical protein